MLNQQRDGSSLTLPQKEVLSGAFFWLSAFYFVYCARPEDWIPGLAYIPLAKITGLFAFLALLMSFGRAKRGLNDLPRESKYLIALVSLCFVAALTSPVWPGGSFSHTIIFAKVCLAWILTFLLITTFRRFRRVIYIQASSVAVIALVSIAKGHSKPRLDGVLGGIYSNPNDLAFAIVLSLPFCLAFLLTAKSVLRKLIWASAMMAMLAALFLTASRAGFIDLLISGAVCLWHFGVRGKRPQLIVVTLLITTVVLIAAGGLLRARFIAMSGEDVDPSVQNAYGSYQARLMLYDVALEGIAHHPLLGVGPHCFAAYSGTWQPVHNAYLQMGVEGGLPALTFYLLFFYSGFANLKKLRKRKDLDTHTTLFVGALHSSLIGFVIGAVFAPEAYQYFPYFAVAHTSVLSAIVREKDAAAASPPQEPSTRKQGISVYARNGDAYAVPSYR